MRGAKGTRTPDFLHAMESESVHSGPPAFTADTAHLPIRPVAAVGVQDSSRRMVTSLVTSRPRTAAPTRRTQAGSRPPAGPIGARVHATPVPAAGRRTGTMTRADRPARPDPDPGQPQSW